MATLVEFLRIEGQAETQGEPWIDFGVVGESEGAAIVDLTLLIHLLALGQTFLTL
jgi:hypothetical protein